MVRFTRHESPHGRHPLLSKAHGFCSMARVKTRLLTPCIVGLWKAEPQAGWNVGFGHLWLQEEPLWADRITASIHLSRHRLEETFIGQIKGVGADTSVAFVDDLIRATAQATSASAELQTMRALATGPEGFVEWRTGLRGAFMISQSQTTVSDNFFTPAELPSLACRTHHGHWRRIQGVSGSNVSSDLGCRCVAIGQSQPSLFQSLCGSKNAWIGLAAKRISALAVDFASRFVPQKTAQGCAALPGVMSPKRCLTLP